MLLSFRLNDMSVMRGGPGKSVWWDKVPSKFDGWTATKFKKAGFRAVPNCVVRKSAFIAPGVVLMPSFVNLGAYVDSGTMVDTWATVGSCAQIGKNCHISGGAGIGGVLEPLQAGPVIIEDNCFIGARAEVAEGVVVREGSVLSMGVYLGASTTIIDRATGETMRGEVPPYSVVVSGTMPGKPLPNGAAGPESLLRGDRQARRRADPLQDLDQRIAAGLNRDAGLKRRNSPGWLNLGTDHGACSRIFSRSARPYRPAAILARHARRGLAIAAHDRHHLDRPGSFCSSIPADRLHRRVCLSRWRSNACMTATRAAGATLLFIGPADGLDSDGQPSSRDRHARLVAARARGH